MINSTNFNLSDATKIEIHRHFRRLLTHISRTEDENYVLDIGNRLYVQNGFSIKPSFPHILQFYFDESLHNFTYDRRDQFTQV